MSMGEGGHFRLLLLLLEVFEGRLKEAWVSMGSESTTGVSVGAACSSPRRRRRSLWW